MESEGNIEVSIVREVGKPVFEMARWLRFLGVLMIVISILYLLGIAIFLVVGLVGSRQINLGLGELLVIAIPVLISILPVILYLWMGNLLYQSGKMAVPGFMNGDKNLLVRSLTNLKTYFIVLGILTLIGMIIGVISICVASFLSIFSTSVTPLF